MKNQYDFMAGIYLDGELYFNKYSLIIDFYTLGDAMKDQNTGVERISYFIYETVQRSIFVQENDHATMKSFMKMGVPVLSVPAPGPFDPIILATLVTKMNVILEDTLVISDAEITSAVGGLLTYVWDSADEDDEVHELVNDEDDTKWWASPAPRFASYPAGTDVEEIEEAKPFPLTWDLLNLGWLADEETDEEEDQFLLPSSLKAPKEGAGTVIKADFTGKKSKKPKKPKK